MKADCCSGADTPDVCCSGADTPDVCCSGADTPVAVWQTPAACNKEERMKQNRRKKRLKDSIIVTENKQ